MKNSGQASHLRFFAAVSAVAMLAGCGSGGGSAFFGEPPAVLANGTILSQADFNNRTFPIYFATGADGTTAAEVARGVGAIRVIDANRLELQLPGSNPVLLTSTNGTDFTDSAGTQFTLRQVNAAYRYLEVVPGSGAPFDLVGSYGFETPDALRTATGTYDQNAAAVMFLREDGNPAVTVLAGTGNLTADFTNDLISGTLFDGSGTTDIDGDSLRDDTLNVTLTLVGGTIDAGGFDGTVTGTATTGIDGGASQSIAPVFTNTDVEGRFYGNTGDAVQATYEGDVAYTVPGVGARNGSIAGYLDAEDN